MTNHRVTDSIAIELRLFGLIGAFQYDKYHISFMASALFALLMCSMGIQQTISTMCWETIDDLTELLYVFAIYVVVCFKLIGLILNRDKLTNMLDGLKEEQMLPSNHLYHDEFVQTVRHIRITSRLFTCLVHMAIFVTIGSTILDQKQMFFCYFPFETRYAFNLQGYWIAYTFQMIYAVYLIQLNISMDILTIALMHCAAVKLKVLRLECEKLCTSTNCIENVNAVKAAVIFHNDTVSYVRDIEKVFSLGLFVQCCLSGSSMCFLMLKAILLDIFTETERFLGVIMVLLGFVSQLFCYCHYGNQIQHQSTKLFTSIYVCKWYELKCNCYNDGTSSRSHAVAIKRSISVMLERTKTPIIVTGGRFFQLTYESYITICKTGYQFFAVFRDILK